MTGMMREAVRFGTVGVTATLMHLVIAWAANRWGGLAPLTANSVAFALAFAVSYLGHFYWTFGRQTGHRRHFARFMVTAAIGYGLSSLIVWVSTARLGLPFEVALVTILLIVPASTWLISRVWAFRPG